MLVDIIVLEVVAVYRILQVTLRLRKLVYQALGALLRLAALVLHK